MRLDFQVQRDTGFSIKEQGVDILSLRFALILIHPRPLNQAQQASERTQILEIDRLIKMGGAVTQGVAGDGQ